MQDRLLSHPRVKRFAEQFGESHRLRESLPCVMDLRRFVYAEHEAELRALLSELD